MSIYFADQSWPKLEAAIAENTLVILPVGQTAGSIVLQIKNFTLNITALINTTICCAFRVAGTKSRTAQASLVRQCQNHYLNLYSLTTRGEEMNDGKTESRRGGD